MSTKTNKPGFVKQKDGLIVNNNLDQLEKYKARVKEIQIKEQAKEKEKLLENRINSLEEKLDLILKKIT